jgi:hypothetical protein
MGELGEESRQVANHDKHCDEIVVVRVASLDQLFDLFELFSPAACDCLEQGSRDPVAWAWLLLHADLGPRIHF